MWWLCGAFFNFVAEVVVANKLEEVHVSVRKMNYLDIASVVNSATRECCVQVEVRCDAAQV